MNLEIETIEQFTPLYEISHPSYSCRYKVFYGGRGGRKSWEFARALLTRAMQKPIRVLCAREFQNSIADSVLKLLADQISLLGLDYFFEIQKTTILGANGTQFMFKGLATQTIDSIKSLEGVDICWVEEAHTVSERSWSILIPTIRKSGSEIWVSFNTDLETDPTYQRFVINTPPSTYLSKVNYLQNPNCSDEMIAEANYLRRVDPESYDHIWLGFPRKHSEAQIFKGKWLIDSFDVDSTFGDPLFGSDWGFSVDPTTMIKSYIKGNFLYIRSEAYKVGAEIVDTPALFDKVSESRNYVVRADNARPEMISHIANAGFRIIAARKWPGSVEDGISFIKSFEKVIIHPSCTHTADEFRLYSYKVDKRTNDVLPDILDKNNHCIDALRYSLDPLIKRQSNDYFL